MEAKGTKAILDGQPVNLITCKDGFWGSLGDGKFLRDGNNKMRVFTKKEAKAGVAQWESENPQGRGEADDALVLAKIEGWKKLLNDKVATSRMLANPPTDDDKNPLNKVLYHLLTEGGNNGFGGKIQPQYTKPDDEQRAKILELLAEFDKLMGENKVVTLLMQFGIKQFDAQMLTARYDNEEEMLILKRSMNAGEIAKAMDYSSDNTWSYARIEVEWERAKQLVGI